MADESPRHRLRKGDRVVWSDPADWPPVPYEGKITGFENDELTYIQVEFDGIGAKVLTEDDVLRAEQT